MKKIILVLLAFFSFSLVLSSCNETSEPDEAGAIILNTRQIKFEQAFVGSTSTVLQAKVSNSNEEVYFKSRNTSVVKLNYISAGVAEVVAAGEGTAEITAYTKSNLTATVSVEVSLGVSECHDLTDVEIVCAEAETLTLKWNAPADCFLVKVEYAQESSPENIIDTLYFKAEEKSAVIEDLVPSTSYVLKVRGANNPETSLEKLSPSFTELKAVTKNIDITQAPSSVTNLTYSADAHSVTFCWDDSNSKYFSEVVIKETSGTLLLGEKPVEEISVSKGIRTATYKALKSSSEYTFTFSCADKFGNVQGDENNSSNKGVEVKIQTKEDIDCPDNISAIEITVEGSNVTAQWNLPLSSDVKNIFFKNNGEELIKAAPNKTSGTFTLASSATLTVCTQDYAGNFSSEISIPVVQESEVPSVSGVTVSAQYTNQLKAQWNEVSGYGVYLVAENISDSQETYTSKVFYGTKGVVSGLDPDNTYRITAYAGISSENYAVRYKVSGSGNSAEGQSKTVIWQIKQPWDSQTVVPYLSSSVDYSNVIITKTPENYTYYKWIVHPALYDSEDTEAFSLEATNLAGESSGIYLFFTKDVEGSTNYNSGNNTWGYTPSAHEYLSMKASLEQIGAETKAASFKLIENSGYSTAVLEGYSAWFNILLCSDTSCHLYSNNYNVSADKNLVTSSGDWRFAYQETIKE